MVHVATPHNIHLLVALLSLGAGKHTLVEKPLGATADEARQIAAAAEAASRITAGETGPPLRPLVDSLATLEVLDAIAANCRN